MSFSPAWMDQHSWGRENNQEARDSLELNARVHAIQRGDAWTAAGLSSKSLCNFKAVSAQGLREPPLFVLEWTDLALLVESFHLAIEKIPSVVWGRGSTDVLL